MIGSTKKVVQTLLAAAIGAAVSFGTTVAVAPTPSEPLAYCEGNCVNDCIDQGASYGRCIGDICWCF
ncbi:hypothetical protein JY651_11095 [Pyxidicoccus parkwayensis]|uniref:Uncharacterized protein n=1 Tax=Pyxidicoccus parkwayensis TaxID=2813578 RepID=A0ABX7P4S0_9BACT|nr:hypothetical protein [Pyxidicoccus parkwaysis]QSQ25431.1 hypothetical protein JY651_11095 [Pyxidicoccus parkwaysis]